ncbi:hypothetical protein [Moraxella catarrhalis]|nr:hypothetical protein [Moraxella catarrhalis]
MYLFNKKNTDRQSRQADGLKPWDLINGILNVVAGLSLLLD